MVEDDKRGIEYLKHVFLSFFNCVFVRHNSSLVHIRSSYSSSYIGGRPSSSRAILCLSARWRAKSGGWDWMGWLDGYHLLQQLIINSNKQGKPKY